MSADLDAYLELLEEQDHYRVVRVLSETKSELTEVVRHDDDPRLFVRKTIAQESGIGSAYQHLLQRQPAAERLQPTCLPRIYQCFSTGETLVVLMEYLDGTTLDQALRVPDRLAKTAELFPRICDATEQLHQWGLIHRDLKPSNILVSEERVCLIDFGIARIPKEGARSDTARFGTSGYAPPEQYGFGQTDQRSDIYALGMVLGFCLTGYEPSELPANQLFESFRGLQGGTLDSYLNVVRRATRPDPQERYISVQELRKAVANAPKAKLRRERSNAPDSQASTTSQNHPLANVFRIGAAFLFLAFFAAATLSATFSETGGISKYPLELRVFVYGALFLLVFVPASLLISGPRPIEAIAPQLGPLSVKRRILLLAVGAFVWVMLVAAIGIFAVA